MLRQFVGSTEGAERWNDAENVTSPMKGTCLPSAQSAIAPSPSPTSQNKSVPLKRKGIRAASTQTLLSTLSMSMSMSSSIPSQSCRSESQSFSGTPIDQLSQSSEPSGAERGMCPGRSEAVRTAKNIETSFSGLEGLGACLRHRGARISSTLHHGVTHVLTYSGAGDDTIMKLKVLEKLRPHALCTHYFAM